MEWEAIGKQELKTPGRRGFGSYTYQVQMWRSPVPGGWLIMALNSRSNSPDPVTSFYPDPEHHWQITQDPVANYLLRATQASAIEDPNLLLRGSDGDDEIKKVEP